MNSQDWARIFAGGLGGWIDSQRPEGGYVNDPTYNTQGGKAGEPQITSVAQLVQSPLVLGGIVLAGVLLLAVVLKK